MRLALAIALLAAATPAFAQDSDYDRAVALRQAGDAAAAAALLEARVAAQPDDVDARVQLGYALLALGRPAEAEAQFEAVLAQSPEYADARDGLALAQARKEGERREAFVLVEGALSDLPAGIDDWHEAGVTLALPVAASDTLELRASWFERFGLEDTEAAALYTHRAGTDTWLRVGASVAPGADFRPEIGLVAGVDRRLAGGPQATVVGLDAQFRSFPAQDVFSLSPSITQYLGDGSFFLTARALALAAEDDRLRVGGSLRGAWEPGDRRRLFAGVAAGPDTDLGVVTDTWSLFGGGELPIGARLSVVGSLAREWREGPADRTEFRIGLKVGL